jgi:hypothetical protein
MRGGGKTSDKVLEQMRKLLAKSVPEKERAVAFDVLDTIGNVRLDRIAGAFQIEDKGNARRIYVRFTGAADAKRILDFIALASKGRVKPETKKGPGGEEIMFIAKDEMAYAFVGNSELVFLGDQEGKNGAGLIDEVLAVKAGKKKSLAEGPLGALLRGVPEDARILFAGEVPEEARKGMTAKGSPLRAAPKNFLFHAVGEEKLTLSLSGTLKDKEEAEAFAESLLGLKQMGLKALDDLPPQAMVPPEVLKRFKQTLQAAKVAADGSSVTGKVTLDSAKVLGDVLKLLMIRNGSSSDKPERR